MNIFADLLPMPPLASEHGQSVDRLITYVHVLMAVLFLGWGSYFLYVLFRFRQTKTPKADPVGATSKAPKVLELVVVGVETAILLLFALPMWAKLSDLKSIPEGKEVTNVRVVAEQFQWNFRYPGKDGVFGRQEAKLVSAANPLGYDETDPAGKDDVTPPMGEMHVPVGKTVVARISSKDVIHSFKVVAFRTTQDAIPGVPATIQFTPTKPGRYMITCAQLCGNGHAKMAGYVVAESEAAYQKWLAEKSKIAVATSFE
jgi:cytochrome c oxidase subunit 2